MRYKILSTHLQSPKISSKERKEEEVDICSSVWWSTIANGILVQPILKILSPLTSVLNLKDQFNMTFSNADVKWYHIYEITEEDGFTQLEKSWI